MLTPVNDKQQGARGNELDDTNMGNVRASGFPGIHQELIPTMTTSSDTNQCFLGLGTSEPTSSVGRTSEWDDLDGRSNLNNSARALEDETRI